MYICKICMQSSYGQPKIEDFVFISSLESSYKCEICLTPFSTGYEAIRKFPCRVCPRVFSTESLLRRHSYEHSNMLPYRCKMCENGFAYESPLLQHAPTHSDDSPLQCSTISNYFMESTDGQHKKEDFVSTSTLESSYKGESRLTPFSKEYESVSKFACNVCPEVFSKQCFLRYHSYEHTNKWPYWCEECGKGFACKSNLHQHAICHSEERPFQCSFCPADFKTKSALNQHLKIHNPNEELQKCSF